MSRATSTRRVVVCAAAVLGLGLLAGCADPTGSNALTARNYTSADGVQGDSDLISARDVLLVSDGQGAATLSAAFGNQSQDSDAVVSISALGRLATVRVGSGLEILPGGALTFGLPSPSSGPQAFLRGSFAPGSLVGLQVRFAHAAALVLDVPVLPRSGYYTDVPGPGPDDATAAPTPAAASPTPSSG